MFDSTNQPPFQQPPIGYRFLPTPDELIHYYLFNKLNNLPLPSLCSNVFNYVDIYASHPSVIFDNVNNNGYNEEIVEETDSGIEKRIRYFFTPVKSFMRKDGKNGKRFSRKAGPGSWKEEQSNSIGKGQERYFRYKLSNGQYSGDDGVEWRMHEYSLVGHHGLAISRITKVVKKDSGRSGSRTSKIVIPVAALAQEQQVVINNNNNNNNNNVVVADNYNGGSSWEGWMVEGNNNVNSYQPCLLTEKERVESDEIGDEFLNMISFENDQQPSLVDAMLEGSQMDQTLDFRYKEGFHGFQELLKKIPYDNCGLDCQFHY